MPRHHPQFEHSQLYAICHWFQFGIGVACQQNWSGIVILSVDGDCQFPFKCFYVVLTFAQKEGCFWQSRWLVSWFDYYRCIRPYKTNSKNREHQDLLHRKQMPFWAGFQNLQVVAQKVSRSSSWSVMYLGCLWYTFITYGDLAKTLAEFLAPLSHFRQFSPGWLRISLWFGHGWNGREW